jgi:hypothetical protein
MLRRSSWLLVTVLVAACGGASSDRFDLKTPGAHTGTGPVVTLAPPPATPTPGATATATATPKPKPGAKAVTSEEKRVIRGWADELRHGHVAAASRYFAVPAFVRNLTVQGRLTSRAAVRSFNETLPCGAKLLSTRRGNGGVVVGTFRLTERPGGSCGSGAGGLAAVAFLVRHHHIARWLRQDDPVPTPTPSP